MTYKDKHYLTDLGDEPDPYSNTNERLQKDCIRLSTELREAQTEIARLHKSCEEMRERYSEKCAEIERLVDEALAALKQEGCQHEWGYRQGGFMIHCKHCGEYPPEAVELTEG